ncbi:MAG: protein-glutamate O-methyltransferase CheR [Thermoleophilaceae bacterium]|nr:protein-glutamate O-methyltransferase CheR [Thermoleophilaceae bacterium]
MADDFQLFCSGLHALVGVDLTHYKRHQMERRARGMAARVGCEDLTKFLMILRKEPAVLDDFMAKMTITVSQLWRNPEIFTVIGEELLPELVQRKRPRKLSLWCAGCSYGAEPYTLAAVCIDQSKLLERPPLIVASDINPRMIERAREGRFSAEDARSAPDDLLRRHFTSLPDGSWQANDDLKAMISFRCEDLFGAPHKAVDLVLCRNVAIHFEADSRQRLHEILANSLVPGGMLVLGSTEMIVRPGELGLERVRPFVFRKV